MDAHRRDWKRDRHHTDSERVREESKRRMREGGEEDECCDRKRHRRSSPRRCDAEHEVAMAISDDEAADKRWASEEKERRRHRGVMEWQKRLHLEREAVMKWTMGSEKGDRDRRDAAADMDVDAMNGGGGPGIEVDELDPLDAFMNSMVLPEVAKLESAAATESSPYAANRDKNATARVVRFDDESDSGYEDADDHAVQEPEDEEEEFMKRIKKTKVKKLAIFDHSEVDYPPFRKSFYIESPEIAKTSGEEAAAYRKQLELKVHGRDVPKPVMTWVQSGLTSKLLDAIKNLGLEKPTPIQAQALPVIMSGRDCIGIAKTGSGKTLAFVLPMLRHVKDQPPAAPGDGPVALVVAPTRELVSQIHSDITKLSKPLGIRSVAIYGGSGVAKINELKKGAEIVVCTPGRMIDILCTSNGKITNLGRVTFLVMDEADRMFDLGFEPQVTRIVQNTRPDRQTVLFSATFPRPVEMLARKVLTKPVEVVVGGRSVVNTDITQLVEVRHEGDRFLRLLELLGEWFVRGKVLVFVHSQDRCDYLLKDLLRLGYPCLSLHGGKDQDDRESTIADFKGSVCNLLVATSVAARGLDVKELELVVNYDVPNHYEEYIHRVGRSGRAGRKGFAVTFISEEEEKYAPDLVRALELSRQAVPEDLKALADSFMAKVKQGTEHPHGSGYGGSGFKFNEEEEEARRSAKKLQAMKYVYDKDKPDSDSEDETGARGDSTLLLPPMPVAPRQQYNAAMVHEARVAWHARLSLERVLARAAPKRYEDELEINDFPQEVRWKITRKETFARVKEWSGAAITTREVYVAQGTMDGTNERKLYLHIEGSTESAVKKAKAELQAVAEDYTNKALNRPGPMKNVKYLVI